MSVLLEMVEQFHKPFSKSILLLLKTKLYIEGT